ncbi:MAG TPA: YihY/virulence factor BrkB family protein [Thermoanaerobaculia bacterium]|jgi:membrane protein|nr:YihY/virulence factor BrkB family protein [Thermoanaerobaculia bacterium]
MRPPKRQEIWAVLKEAVANWERHGATTQSGALAFYFVTALAPILILVIAFSGLFYGREAVQGQVQRELARYVGAETAGVVQEIVKASARPDAGWMTAMIGTVTLVVTATGALAQLQDALNTVWEVVPKPRMFVRRLLKKRLLCLLLIVGVGALVLLSLAASAGVAALQSALEARLEFGTSTLLGWVDVVLSWLLMTVLLAMVYRILPDVALSWLEVAWGSTLTAGLFLLGKYGIGLYLGKTGTTSTYGAAGSLVAILLWIYYSSLIFLFGAEVTRVQSRRYREGHAPAEPGAERVVTVQVPLEAAK